MYLNDLVVFIRVNSESMKSTKLLSLYQTLSAKEQADFTVYVQSPYFNTNEKLVRLANFLQEEAPGYETCSKERAFAAIFGSKTVFKKQWLYDNVSGLLRLLEGFLTQQEFERSPLPRGRTLLASLNQRHALKHFSYILRNQEQELAHREGQNAGFYLEKYLLSVEVSAFYGKQKNRAFDEALLDVNESLDVFYLAAKLRVACEIINREHMLNVPHQQEQMEVLKPYLFANAAHYMNFPVIAIYHHIYLSMREDEEESHYQELVKLLAEHAGSFEQEEAANMYAYAQNYCIRKINRGNSAYLEELFKIYQSMLQNELILREGYLRHEHYKNITTVGLRLKRFDWVHQFLENYRDRLPEEQQENAYNYNLASFYYEQKDFNRAMRLLQQVQFTDVYYHLSAKSMLLKIYFEEEEEEAFKYHLLAFTAYLKRNKHISRSYLNIHENLVRFAKKAFQLRKRKAKLAPADFEARVHALLEKIDEEKAVANINWLKQQIKQL